MPWSINPSDTISQILSLCHFKTSHLWEGSAVRLGEIGSGSFFVKGGKGSGKGRSEGVWTQLVLRQCSSRGYMLKGGSGSWLLWNERKLLCVPLNPSAGLYVPLNLSAGMKVLEPFVSYCCPLRNTQKGSLKNICVSVFPAFMSMCHVYFWCLWWPEEGISHADAWNYI